MFMVVLVIIFSISLVLLLTLVNLLISDYSLASYSREEASSYECGFEQHSLSRVPLSVRYFLLTLVFLVFDLEVVLLLFSPMDLLSGVSSSYVLLVSFLFISVLALGLLFEWYDGALDWVI